MSGGGRVPFATGAVASTGGGGASTADAVSFTPTGTIAATDVQAAVAEVASEGATADGLLVAKSLYDANTILKADSDDTPAALTVAASRIVGRKASGSIAALTGAEVQALLPGVAADVLIDAKGDLIVGTAADTAARLAVGSDGQVLTADAASTPGVKWAAAAGGGSVASDTIWDAAGDLAVGSGADTAAKLSKGTALQTLQVNAAATALEWATPFLYVRKTADESVTSSAVLQNDDHLTLAVDINASYVFEVFFIYDGATTGDIQIAFTVPASAVINWVGSGVAISTSTASSSGNWALGTASAGVVQFGGAGSGTKVAGYIRGLVRTAGTSGSLTMQWAQRVSDGTATTVYTDSFLTHRRVA